MNHLYLKCHFCPKRQFTQCFTDQITRDNKKCKYGTALSIWSWVVRISICSAIIGVIWFFFWGCIHHTEFNGLSRFGKALIGFWWFLSLILGGAAAFAGVSMIECLHEEFKSRGGSYFPWIKD